jgi:hypothetical protein
MSATQPLPVPPASSPSGQATITPIEALNRFSSLATGFITAQWFRTACNLALFDVLAKEPQTSAEIASRLSIKPDACRSFLSALADLGLLEATGDRWTNSALGALLTTSAEVPLHTLGTWVEIFYPMWQYLADALKEGTPRYEQTLGTSAAQTWEALFADPARLRLFCRFMNAYSIPIGREIADYFRFDEVQTILDVAGGAGGMSAQFVRRHPHLRAMLMDLPPVCEIAREDLTAAGVLDRFTIAPGDLFNGPYPRGADAIVLSWILHDWSDSQCRTILRNCFEALPPGGVLLVSELVLQEDGTQRPFGNIMNMHMLIACDPGARERTEAEYRGLLEANGFEQVKLTRLSGPRDLLVARKSSVATSPASV